MQVMDNCRMNRIVICGLLVPLMMLLLTGCHSSRRSSAGVSDGGYRDGLPSRIDYSGELEEPMGQALVEAASAWLGTRYKYGGHTRAGTDCSGLVMSLYQEVCAVKLPRTTSDQHKFCSPLKRKDTRVGDLVFFGSSYGISHVGLYIGKGEMIHASSSQGVMVSGIDKGYWADRFKGGGRVDGAAGSWAMNNGKGKGWGKSAGKRKSGDEPAKETPQQPELSVELLDLIINEKVDSIFSSQFMD